MAARLQYAMQTSNALSSLEAILWTRTFASFSSVMSTSNSERRPQVRGTDRTSEGRLARTVGGSRQAGGMRMACCLRLAAAFSCQGADS